jgi:predicted ATPase
MLNGEVRAFHAAASAPGPVVFDRGLPDSVGFFALGGMEVPADVEAACRTLRYEGPIFRAPPWRQIYSADEQRIQSWEEAIASDEAVCAAWRRYGNDLVD